ncbi:MAG: putative colanic acid biosynthesis UDP-glucose lipid carrier transferase, partial [Maribacter sp.]
TFIPDNKEIFTKELKLDFYEYLPILSLREIPLDSTFNRFYKRMFDVIISLFVVFFILSWLFPIIGLFIILESKGPVYFIQNRPGFKEEGFLCYKFRTMRINDDTEKSATRNDPRVTKLGALLRRTSLDELPQFINVLLGDMSIVGPRPHLWRQNHEYNSTVQRYMLRHYVSPGITGLAQAKGFRGEIQTNEDIINRIRYDVFYIENWSILLDIKIMIQTAVNIIKGEDKAY